ncbi:expressed unknown protein [Seminavis robusta]|uniref:Jacalin-type lectin domain-containing protein n=1 Tax=Seminavis robusta TaxID=568900 RepID=A0A9N8ETE0_9STRA|nr:expressed unknown protein [Seminavis robusta]|eukprot:Sro1530_g280070.1 n/a (307) ;mRNA; r:6731-7905
MPPPHHDHHHHHHHHEMEDWDDYWWHELPKDKQDAATVLGWTEKMWDDDGKADTEDLDWGELSHEQKKAAEAFGYHPKLWDEGPGHHPPHHHPPHHHDHHHHHPHEDHKPDGKPKEEEKKDGDDEEPDISNLNVNDGDKKESDKKEKPQFKVSKTFGGGGGAPFDHGNNRNISKITVFHDGHAVRGLEVHYGNMTKKAGECKGKSKTLELNNGEFITGATVRSNELVQSLAFKTNKGTEFGPVGGKGWSKLNPLGFGDKEGEEVKVPAPFKFQLVGFSGKAGSYIDQVAFRWGPVPQMNKKQQQSK